MTNCHLKLLPAEACAELLGKRRRAGGTSWRWETLGMLRECEPECPSVWLAFLARLFSLLLLGDWQAKVMVSARNRPYLKGRCPLQPPPPFDTIPPPANGIKVAQCTPLLHQRDLPHLLLSWAYGSVPLWRPSHLKSAVSRWQDKVSALLLTMIWSSGRQCSASAK